MDRIDHSNYEAYLLDRMEGTLSREQESELLVFLIEHPELAPSDLDLPTLNDPTIALSERDRNALKRTLPPSGMPGEAPIDDLLIAKFEGDLTSLQQESLSNYLVSYPEHAQTERLYAMARVAKDTIAYPMRDQLTRDLPPQGMPGLHTMDDFLVARLEGDLNGKQETALSGLIMHDPAALRNWELLQRTRVQPDTLAYPFREELKKGGKVIPIGGIPWTRLAVAASIALLFATGVWYLGTPELEPKVVVDARNAKPVPEKHPPIGTKDVDILQSSEVPLSTKAVTGPEMTRPDRSVIKEQPELHKPSKAREVQPAFEREEIPALAVQRPNVPTNDAVRPKPIDVPIPDVPAPPDAALAMSQAAGGNEMGIRDLFVSSVREQVLAQPAQDTSPVDGDDAVAFVDRGLKAVAGDRAGLDVTRKSDGGLSGFNLRLGRNLSITAGH